MVEQAEPTLTRHVSSVPTSCTQIESTVLNASMNTIWPKFRDFKFVEIAPEKVKAAEFTSGVAGQVGATVKLTYTDGATWEIRITEISEKYHRLGFELIIAEPAAFATSIQTELEFYSVTSDDHTFVRWTTEFSNDADASVIQDQKYKKQEFFSAVKANL